jgi:hypothetical protein
VDGKTFQTEQVKSGSFSYHNGRLYFTRQFERRLFFIGTIIMMAWGLLDKLGIV